jgi:hypothetical protein
MATLRQTASHQWRAKRFANLTEGVEDFVRLVVGDPGAAVTALDVRCSSERTEFGAW